MGLAKVSDLFIGTYGMGGAFVSSLQDVRNVIVTRAIKNILFMSRMRRQVT